MATTEDRLTSIENALLGIAFSLDKLLNGVPATPTAPVPPVVVTPVPVVPKREYKYLPNGLLEGADIEPNTGGRIDPVVDGDCPTATRVQIATPSDPQATKVFYVSKPRPDLKERWMGYLMRVSKQCHGGLGSLGTAGYKAEGIFAEFGGFSLDGSNWEKGAVKFHSTRADPNQQGDWISKPSAPADPTPPAPQGPVDVAIG